MLAALARVTLPLLVVVATFATGCAGRDVTASQNGSQVEMPDGAMAEGGPCNDLANDAPVTHAICAQSCSCAVTGTKALADGTYVLHSLVNYTQDCAQLAAGDVRGKIRVSGNVIDLVIQQPASAVGDTTLSRMRYTFKQSGSTINMQWICPPSEDGVASQAVTYASDGRNVKFTILPGTHGDSVFVKQ